MTSAPSRSPWTVRRPATVTMSVLLALAGAGRADASPPYDRAVERAIERVQPRLEAAARIWVDRSRWENAWVVSSQHFTVRTTKSHAFGEAVARGLEGMLSWFRYDLGGSIPEGDRIPIWILPDISGYNVQGENLGGDHSSKYGCFYAGQDAARAVITYAERNEIYGRQLATHGALSAYLDRAFPVAAPLWIDEGLACYYEIHWDYKNSLDRWNVISQDASRFIPLANLKSASMSQYTPDHFAQLGMWFLYLMWVREDTRTVRDDSGAVTSAPFRDYLRRLLNGESIAEDPVHTLLTSGLAEVESDFRKASFPSNPPWL